MSNLAIASHISICSSLSAPLAIAKAEILFSQSIDDSDLLNGVLVKLVFLCSEVSGKGISSTQHLIINIILVVLD